MAFGSSSRFKVGGKGSSKAPGPGFQKMHNSEPGGGGSKGSAPEKRTYVGIKVAGFGGSGTRVGSRKSLSASIPSGKDPGTR